MNLYATLIIIVISFAGGFYYGYSLCMYLARRDEQKTIAAGVFPAA